MYSQESSELLARITVNPDVMVGKPVIRGMRITVEQILKALGGGVLPPVRNWANLSG